MKHLKYFEEVKPFSLTTPEDKEEWSTVNYNDEDEIIYLTNLLKECLSNKKLLSKLNNELNLRTKSVIVKSLKNFFKEI
jgi:uncharacterized protein YjgD (DUF1641 family)